eukprot:8967612-Alexandrium_andersonii.AAC.1
MWATGVPVGIDGAGVGSSPHASEQTSVIQPLRNPSRVYLKVPRQERNDARMLGAKCNPDAMLWYIEHGSDLAKFA